MLKNNLLYLHMRYKPKYIQYSRPDRKNIYCIHTYKNVYYIQYIYGMYVCIYSLNNVYTNI